MKSISNIGLDEVRAVYNGPEGQLWELIMGQQIHIGGFASSTDLADRAGIFAGATGIDLCCCNGAGMRFLVRFRKVGKMTGVDAAKAVVEQGRQRCREEGLDGQVEFVLADACENDLPDGQADFVWGEDAWCYVVDKSKLIGEAARLVRPGGMIAFTDWIEGPKAMTKEESDRYLMFMKFPNIQDLAGYTSLLEDSGCEVMVAEDTGRFAPYVDLYVNMLQMQLTYDALKIIDFSVEMLAGLADEMAFMQKLAHQGKIAQGMFVARKK